MYDIFCYSSPKGLRCPRHECFASRDEDEQPNPSQLHVKRVHAYQLIKDFLSSLPIPESFAVRWDHVATSDQWIVKIRITDVKN